MNIPGASQFLSSSLGGQDGWKVLELGLCLPHMESTGIWGQVFPFPEIIRLQ